MDFLDPRKRKAHVRRLYIGYVLTGIAIGLGAIILLFASSGYGVDRRGNVFQNGLVFLASNPDSAQVKITNQQGTFSDTVVTSKRLELKADTYNFQFLKQGYKPWEHEFIIRGGSLERLTYPFLVPETLKTDVDETYSTSPGLVTQSPNREVILVQQPKSLTNFQVFAGDDTSREPTALILPSGLLPAGSGYKKYQLVEWSTDNRHLIVSYEAASGPVFLEIDRENPEQSRNLNTFFDVEPTKITFRDKDPDRFYILLPDKRLMAAEADDKSMSALAGGVLDFKSHGDDDLLFVTTNGAKAGKARAIVRSDDRNYDIRELARTDHYVLDLAQYNNKWYVVVGAGDTNETYIYRDPVLALQNANNSTTTIRTMRLDNPQKVQFSANSRFIAVQNGSNFVVYDAEKDQQYKFTVNPKFQQPEYVRWMDGHRLMGVTNGKVLIIDFDGTNPQTLSAITAGTLPMFDDNFEQLNTLAPQGKGSALTNTSMRLP